MGVMREGRRLAAAAGVAGSLAAALSAAPPVLDPSVARRIDAVFADVDTPASPGCAVGVVRDGALVYARGYGQASVELGVPVTPDTVFDVGSVSKQFTAFALELLVHEGKVGLDDEVRRHVPELPAYEHPITIRHILSHTSGLRDYNDLLMLAGADERDVTTAPQALAMIARQRGLEFQPGTSWRYSNTGFFLAALVVERVAREPLPAFAARRMFGPLGMSATRFAGSHVTSVPRHATGYEPDQGRFGIFMSNWQQVGDGGVRTSINDIARWSANLDGGAVGGLAILTEMATPGRLNDGTKLGYGLGQFVGDYRGLHRVYHSGSWAGFRAELDRYPDARTAIAVLCNRTDARPNARAERVADLVLASRFTLPSPHGPVAQRRATAAGARPESVAGPYWSDTLGLLVRFDAADGTLRLLHGGTPEPLDQVALDRYARRGGRVEFAFTRDAQGRHALRVEEAGEPSIDLLGLAPWTPSAADLSAFVGAWRSDELGTSYVLELRENRLVRRSPTMLEEPLVPAFDRAFEWKGRVIRVGADGRTMDLVIGPGAPIRFTRIVPATK